MPLNLRPLPRDYLPLSITVIPQAAADRQKLAEMLRDGVRDLGAVRTTDDPEGGLTMLNVGSERDLDIAMEALRGAGIAMTVGAPRIAYREILSAPVEAAYTHAKQTSGGGDQFARVKLRLEPNARSMSNTFMNEAPPDVLPPEFAAAVEKGFRAVIAGGGPMTGFPIVACHATLLDGAYHDVDSTPLAFEIASRAAIREALPATAVKLLEPYLEIDITVPDAFAGAVVADFKSRRGVNTLKEASPGVAAIYGFAPLASMLGYEASLAALTQGQATYSWKLAGLEEFPMGLGPPAFSPAAAMRR